MPHDLPKRDNTGRPPRCPPETLVWVTWANGQDSKQPYRADGLRWSITGHPFDVGKFWRA